MAYKSPLNCMGSEDFGRNFLRDLGQNYKLARRVEE